MGFQTAELFRPELTTEGRRSNSNPQNFEVKQLEVLIFKDKIINLIGILYPIIVRQKNRKYYNKKQYCLSRVVMAKRHR